MNVIYSVVIYECNLDLSLSFQNICLCHIFKGFINYICIIILFFILVDLHHVFALYIRFRLESWSSQSWFVHIPPSFHSLLQSLFAFQNLLFLNIQAISFQDSAVFLRKHSRFRSDVFIVIVSIVVQTLSTGRKYFCRLYVVFIYTQPPLQCATLLNDILV
jgi:hypothetical protein